MVLLLSWLENIGHLLLRRHLPQSLQRLIKLDAAKCCNDSMSAQGFNMIRTFIFIRLFNFFFFFKKFFSIFLNFLCSSFLFILSSSVLTQSSSSVSVCLTVVSPSSPSSWFPPTPVSAALLRAEHLVTICHRTVPSLA